MSEDLRVPVIMAADAKALLDSLMGADRNAKADERVIRKFFDDDICKNFLMGLCPHDLFGNTKIDLGACSKEHHEPSKDAFEASADRPKYTQKWRGALRLQLKRLLEGVDRRIGSNQLRIAREKEGGPAGASEEQKANLASLKEQVSDKLKEAEKAADDGHFDASRNIMKDTEATKRRIEDLEQKRYEKYRKEDICDICGLIIDSEEREAMKTGRGWHSNGKQHIGYGLIRDKLKEIELAQAEDRKNGTRSPSPDPVKVERSDGITKLKRKASKSRSQGRRHKSKSRRRKSKSRSPSRGKKVDSKKRKVSRSRSRRRKASRSRSRAKKKRDGKKRSDSSSDRRKKSRSKSRKARSRSKKKKDKKDPSPKRKEPSPKKKDPSPKKKGKSSDREKEQKKKEKKKDKKVEAKPPKPDGEKPPPPPPPTADDEAKQASSVVGEMERKAAEALAALAAAKEAADKAAEKAAAEKKAAEKKAAAEKAEEEQSARNRKAPVFMVFRPKAA